MSGSSRERKGRHVSGHARACARAAEPGHMEGEGAG